MPPTKGAHRVRIDGQSPTDLLGDLLTIQIDEGFSRPAEAVIEFVNPPNQDGRGSVGARGYQHFDDGSIRFGSRIEIDVHDGGATWRQLFAGETVSIEASFSEVVPRLWIRAFDDLYKLERGRRSEAFQHVSLRDVAREIAGEHALQAIVDRNSTTTEQLVRLGGTDLEFLVEQAARVGLDVWIQDERLRVGRFRPERSFTLSYPRTLHELRASADLRGQPTEVIVTGWDVDKGELVESRARDSVLISSGGGTSAAAHQSDVHGDIDDQRVHPAAGSKAIVKGHAVGILRRTGGRFVSVQGTASGDHRLRLGRRVKLQGVGPIYEGTYRTSRAVHHWSEDAQYTTRFEAERAFTGETW